MANKRPNQSSYPQEEMQQQQYPQALPSDYQLPQGQYATYYNHDPSQALQQPMYSLQEGPGNGGAWARQQQQQQYQQQYQQQQYAGASGNIFADEPGPTASQNLAAAPADGSPVATPGYYDYTVPLKYAEVTKFDGSNEWVTSMCKAPCADPCFCFSAFFCPCCCTYMQRQTLLVNDFGNYRCCAGIFGNCCGACDTNCGCCAPFCLAMEVACCLACAVHGNRHMVMRHYNLKQDCCDSVLWWAACLMQVFAMIFQCELLHLAADCVYYSVVACTLTQHNEQMKKYPYPTASAMV